MTVKKTERMLAPLYELASEQGQKEVLTGSE